MASYEFEIVEKVVSMYKLTLSEKEEKEREEKGLSVEEFVKQELASLDEIFEHSELIMFGGDVIESYEDSIAFY